GCRLRGIRRVERDAHFGETLRGGGTRVGLMAVARAHLIVEDDEALLRAPRRVPHPYAGTLEQGSRALQQPAEHPAVRDEPRCDADGPDRDRAAGECETER